MNIAFKSPSLVDFDLTNDCNLTCEYCCYDAGKTEKKQGTLTLEEIKNTLAELDRLNVLRVSLGGGEPFLREDFFDILEEAQKYKYAITINSNGTLITEEVGKMLSNYRFNMICISVDGSNEETHDRLRGKGSFHKTINGIKLLQKYNIPITVLFTLNKHNVDNLIDSIKFNEQIGIDRMTVMVVCPTGRASDGNILTSKEQWYPTFLKLSEMKQAGEIKLKFRIAPPNEGKVHWFFYFPLKHYNRLDLLSVWNQDENSKDGLLERTISCQAGTQVCAITHNGDVYGCDLMVGIDELVAGNIRNNSFEEIWSSSEVFKTLREIEFQDLQGKCKDCDLSWCGAGCRSAAFHMSGQINGSDESCFYFNEK